MRNKIGTAVAVLGLTALSLTATATTAQAGSGCDAQWAGRSGNVYAWQHWDCGGYVLGVTPGNDPAWGDGYGAFRHPAQYEASSVMNAGFIGGNDVVAFYGAALYSGTPVCLSPHEVYADNLTDNYYPGGGVVNDRIYSHRWVTASACAAGSWLT
jgi:hypothetical protein